MEPLDMELLRRWIGRDQERYDVVEPNKVAALAATLDCGVTPAHGDALPAGWHWVFFNPIARRSEIGADGHPTRGNFLPPVPLARRMWAGGRLRFLRPIHVGDRVRKVSRVTDVQDKTGRSGPLIFVQVAHEVTTEDGLALVEEQDIVYRPAPSEGGAMPPAPPLARAADWSQDIVPDDVLLFRYSALTFNAHRIHYDRRYVTEVEGYPGLIVHGPLLATLLMELIRHRLPAAQLEEFRFKAVRPTFDTSRFSIHGNVPNGERRCVMWSTDNDGMLAMDGEATLRDQG